MPWTIFIHSLSCIRKLARSLCTLVRLLIPLNSWIKIVRAHFPWRILYVRDRLKFDNIYRKDFFCAKLNIYNLTRADCWLMISISVGCWLGVDPSYVILQSICDQRRFLGHPYFLHTKYLNQPRMINALVKFPYR